MRNEPGDGAVIAMADELAKHQTGLGGKTTAPCPVLHAAHEPVLAAPSGPGRSPRKAGQHQAVSELIAVARLTVASGEEDAILAALPRLIAASRTESGNLDVDGYRSLSDRGPVHPHGHNHQACRNPTNGAASCANHVGGQPLCRQLSFTTNHQLTALTTHCGPLRLCSRDLAHRTFRPGHTAVSTSSAAV